MILDINRTSPKEVNIKQYVYVGYISAELQSSSYHLVIANTQKMFIKLVVFVTFVEVTLGSNEGELPVPSPSGAIDENLQRPQEVTVAFIAKQHIKTTYNYRYGYEVQDPSTGVTTSQYEIRYNDVNLGIYNTVATNEDSQSTVNYTIDAANGYRATFAADSPERMTLDYAHITSPLATATPPNDGKEAFKSFLIDDRENIEKHSPHAESALKTYNICKKYFHLTSTHKYSWGYELEGIRSQFHTYRGDNGEGRMVLVNADGCVSSVDYTVDATHFNVSTVRSFGKQEIAQLYLNAKHYPLLLQIVHGSAKCDI